MAGRIACFLACAAASARALAIHEAPAQLPHGWEADGTMLEASTQHTLRFWLKPSRGMAALEDKLMAVSTPGSPEYRVFPSHADIAQLCAPRDGWEPELRAWLGDGGDVHGPVELTVSKHGDFVSVTRSVSAWEGILGSGLRFVRLSNPASKAKGRHVVRLEPSPRVYAARNSQQHVPPALTRHVAAIFGLTDLYPIPAGAAATADPTCKQFKGQQVDPDVLAKQYRVPPPLTTPLAKGMSQGVAAFEDAEFKPTDVAQFQRDFNLTAVDVQILGPNNGGYYGEASLDTQYIFSTGAGIPAWYLSQENFDLLEWSWTVMNMTAPPRVLSVSWGNGESGFDADHMQATNREFAKMGLSGITILAASGDDGTNKQGIFCKKFDPTWPTSSPYVTSVGGTYLDTTGKEIGWSDSGGGFSAVFARPSYQDDAVSRYLKTSTLPPANYFNTSGRASPDVSALSTNFKVLSNGAYGCLSGTSAATPVFAGIISRINNMLLAQEKPPVGFINPALYKAGSGTFGFDVAQGNNKAQFCSAGFQAQEGYDCVSGISTPDFELLAQVLGAK